MDLNTWHAITNLSAKTCG